MTLGSDLGGQSPGGVDARYFWKGRFDPPGCRTLCLPWARIELKMTMLLAHNPMVSVRALKGG